MTIAQLRKRQRVANERRELRKTILRHQSATPVAEALKVAALRIR